jgi:hypothetical protein
MAVLVTRVRAELSARRTAVVVLLVLTAVVTAVLLAGVTGARRTASAMDRFVAYSRPVDVAIAGTVDAGAVQRLPQVAAVEQTAVVPMVPQGWGAQGPSGVSAIFPVVRFRGTQGRVMARPIVVAGRLPDPADPEALAIGESLAASRHLGPGSVITVRTFLPTQQDAVGAVLGEGPVAPAPAGPVVRLRVAAVQREPYDLRAAPVSPDIPVQDAQVVFLTPAFGKRYADSVAMSPPDIQLRLRRGPSDFPAFSAAVALLPRGAQAEPVLGSQALDVAPKVTTALRFEAAALLALALAAGCGLLLLVGQGLDRETRWYGEEHTTLRWLGMTGPQLVGIATLRSVAIVLPGVALGVPLAIAASALFPVGLASRAEVSPGIWVDVPVLVAGSAALALLLVLRGTAGGLLAIRAADPARRREHSRRPALLVRLVATGLPLTVVTGMVRALRRGRRGGPRPALIVAVGTAGVVAVAGSLTLGATLDRLLRTPSLQGWNWDVMVGYQSDPDFAAHAARTLRDDPRVSGLALYGPAGAVDVGGQHVPALSVAALRGTVGQHLVSGRPASAPDEVVLGHDTARRLGAALGEEVPVAANGRVRHYRVVGHAVLWLYSSFRSQMGTGAVLTPEGARRLRLEAAPGHVLVGFAAGVPKTAAFHGLQAQFGPRVWRYVPTEEVQNLHRVRGLPFAVAGLFATVGLLGVATALVASVRSGRYEVAVLKALGLVRRQVYATVTWQAVTHGVLALAVGIPLGIAAGNWAWTLLGAAIEARMPAEAPGAELLAAIPLAVAAVIVVATVPASTAATVRPAATLRAE